jgi:hypothetical protein
MDKSTTVYARALQRAADILGDEEVLAAFLGAPWEEVHRWVTGARQPPIEAFLLAVDIITQENRVSEARNNVLAKRKIRFAAHKPRLSVVK